MQIHIIPRGTVSIWGPKRLLTKARQYIEELANQVDDEITFHIEVREPDAFQPLREVMPSIINLCNGPTNAAAYDRVVQFDEDSDLHGARLIAAVTGSRALVDNIVNACKGWFKARTPTIKQVEIPSYKTVALMSPDILGLESLPAVGAQVGLGDVSIELLPDMVIPESSFASNVDPLTCFRILELRGPAGGCFAAIAEIERRLDDLTGLQMEVDMPGWMKNHLRQLRTKETLEAFGVVVDNSMQKGSSCRWILSSRDGRSLNRAKEHLDTVVKQILKPQNQQRKRRW